MSEVRDVGVVKAESLIPAGNIIQTLETALDMNVYASREGVVLVTNSVTLTPEKARELGVLLGVAADLAEAMRRESEARDARLADTSGSTGDSSGGAEAP